MWNKFAVPLLVLPLAAISAGCSRGKSIDRDQVRSEIRSARSFAAESEMFIDFVLEGRATRVYAEGHAAYVRDEVEQSAKDLDSAVAEPDVADYVRACRMQLNELIGGLSEIRAALGDTDRLAAAKAKMKQIRESLPKANP
jgi:hypothetical protein